MCAMPDTTPSRILSPATQRLFVLTGAGCSTNSGIPDYRDSDGNWKRTRPVTIQAFLGDGGDAATLLGAQHGSAGAGSGARRRTARIARWPSSNEQGRRELLLTQNVDRLHQAAGSQRVIDLHGRLDVVRCLGCGATTAARAVSGRAGAAEPGLAHIRCRRCSRRRRRPRAGFFVVRGAGLRCLRRRAETRCGVLRRERAARYGGVGAGITSNRPMPCWSWARR